MTKTFAAIFAAVALSLASAAVAADVPGPIKLPAPKAFGGKGAVTFNHNTHATLKCTACHADEKGGDIAGIGKDVEQKKAHAACQDCHKKEGKGPKACKECHKG